MSAAFTPGPWFTTRPHGTIYVEANLRGTLIQEVAAVGPTETAKQQEANARLIAAAPDLLAVLIEAANTLESCRYSERPMAAKCRAVIAKAGGEA